MVIAYHLILSAYGFWLPNDPRGSWSDFVRAYELHRAGGDATKTATRRSVAGKEHDRARRVEARKSLARKPVRFTGRQAQAIGAGFLSYTQSTGCRLCACAILPNHVHLVVARHRVQIEAVCEQLKGRATAELNRRGLHPFAGQVVPSGRTPTPWARLGWWVYLDKSADVTRAIEYVEANPMKDGLPMQTWRCVTPWDVGESGSCAASAKQEKRETDDLA